MNATARTNLGPQIEDRPLLKMTHDLSSKLVDETTWGDEFIVRYETRDLE
jgi:hypothetical protein